MPYWAPNFSCQGDPDIFLYNQLLIRQQEGKKVIPKHQNYALPKTFFLFVELVRSHPRKHLSTFQAASASEKP